MQARNDTHSSDSSQSLSSTSDRSDSTYSTILPIMGKLAVGFIAKNFIESVRLPSVPQTPKEEETSKQKLGHNLVNGISGTVIILTLFTPVTPLSIAAVVATAGAAVLANTFIGKKDTNSSPSEDSAARRTLRA